MASPYLALWNRLTDLDPADLDAVFACHELVKATLMRITLQAVHVHAEDYRAFREAMMGAPCCERPTPLSFKPSATDVTELAGRFYTPPCNVTV
jgi:hypothetical protein